MTAMMLITVLLALIYLAYNAFYFASDLVDKVVLTPSQRRALEACVNWQHQSEDERMLDVMTHVRRKAYWVNGADALVEARNSGMADLPYPPTVTKEMYDSIYWYRSER